jgi:hypothetical protein
MEELYSTWCDRRLAIDGRDGYLEWNGALHPCPGKDVTVGLLNDDRMLYIRLSTQNRAIQRRILDAGLMVWIDETGGRDQAYGIHFPLPNLGTDRDFEHPPEPGRRVEKGADRPDGPLPFPDLSRGNIEITRPGKSEFSVIAADHSDPYGIRCRIGSTRGTLVYELQVPLIRDEKTATGIATNMPQMIGIGLVTGEESRPAPGWGDGGADRGGRRGPGGTGRGPEGRGGGMGPPPQGPPDGTGGGGREKVESVDLWLKVHLATRP